jgi:IS30 family transposase
LRRDAATRGGNYDYRALAAQWHADRAARRPRPSRLANNAALQDYVQARLAGEVANGEGVNFSGPGVIWKGRRAVHRQSRRWSSAWCPEQIARRLELDYPEDPPMRISHGDLLSAVYPGRGALRRELTACLRSGRVLRVPRERARNRGKSFIDDTIMISERPPEIGDRAVPGHWEGDLILGLGSSAIGPLVEHTTRFTMLLHLPRMEGHQPGKSVNGPALAGHGADAVRNAIARSMQIFPPTQAIADMGSRRRDGATRPSRIDTGLEIYFCNPQSPWQRGTNENTNGLLRKYFPKGTDLSLHSADCRATIRVRKRDKQDENPVCRDRRRA